MILRKTCRASVTLEAALVLPVFLFFSVTLLAPIRWLDDQRKMQTELEQFCENASLYAYGREEAPDDETCQLNHIWREQIPFFPSVFGGVKVMIGAERRYWVGLNGKLKGNANGDSEAGAGDAVEMVYVGAGMGRYHLYRDCHYIYNEYRSISRGELSSLRSSDGSYLKACDRCGSKNAVGSVVYYTPGGSHYHSRKDCSAMIYYVRRVPLKDVAVLGLCSYCAGMKYGD